MIGSARVVFEANRGKPEGHLSKKINQWFHRQVLTVVNVYYSDGNTDLFQFIQELQQ